MQPYPSSEPLYPPLQPAQWDFLPSSPCTSEPSDAAAPSPSFTSSSFTPMTVATTLRVALFWFVAPLLRTLDQAIDRRLVRTFLCTLEAIVQLRHRTHGLLLSELGAYLMPPEHAPAGTKQLSNLLHSAKWSANIISAFLWQQALTRHQQMIQEQMIQKEDQRPPLLLWDESVIEKPESLHAEGLCPVRSSKAKRLTHIKPGFYTPPTKPIFVPGMNWISLLLCGPTGAPLVAAMQWWTTRGPLARDRRTLQIDLLKRCTQAFGTQVLQVVSTLFCKLSEYPCD